MSRRRRRRERLSKPARNAVCDASVAFGRILESAMEGLSPSGTDHKDFERVKQTVQTFARIQRGKE